MDTFDLKEDDVVVIRAGEDWPEHLFRILDIYDDCASGYSISGPLEGAYGEPSFDLFLRVHSRS